MSESKFNIKTKSKIMNLIMDHMPDKWEGLTDDEKLRLLYPSDFSLEAEEKGMETAPIYFDNEEAMSLMISLEHVYRSVPKNIRDNSEFVAKSVPPLFWFKIGAHSTIWINKFSNVTQKREAHIEVLNILVPNLKAFVQIGSLFVR